MVPLLHVFELHHRLISLTHQHTFDVFLLSETVPKVFKLVSDLPVFSLE